MSGVGEVCLGIPVVDIVDGVGRGEPELPVSQVLELKELALVREGREASVEELEEVLDGDDAHIRKYQHQIIVEIGSGGFKKSNTSLEILFTG
jgi:hypothetical protein